MSRFLVCRVAVLMVSTATTNAWTSTPVPLVSRVDEFDPNIHYFHHSSNPAAAAGSAPTLTETPVLIQNVLNPSECETMCDALLRTASSLPVDVQRKRRNTALSSNEIQQTTDIYPCTLQQGIAALMESSHDDARLVFEEGLLGNHRPDSGDESLTFVQQRLDRIHENLFHNDKVDWLKLFPPEIAPTSCVVMAGEGATSTLHRDPMEWTGTSLCLEGTKVWRFVPPQPTVVHIDRQLESYRLNSIAWGESDDLTISAGWQSDFTLYDERSETIPSAREFDEMELEKKRTKMNEIASSSSLLQPNLKGIDSVWTVVQEPGDLLVIPAYWWHQTYALEPSIAIASQRCGTIRDAPRLVRHIINTSGLDKNTEATKMLVRETYEDSIDVAQNVIDDLLEVLSTS